MSAALESWINGGWFRDVGTIITVAQAVAVLVILWPRKKNP